jgi:L-alanine-DL-glutamate epimerase-like enolase superfamily enzyme
MAALPLPSQDNRRGRIDAVETAHLRIPFLDTPSLGALGWEAHVVLVRLRTEDVEGLGYAWDLRADRARAIRFAVRDLASDLVGWDAREIRHVWRRMWKIQRHMGQHHGIGLAAISAIDMALWDAMGKRAGMPLYQLWGAARNAVRVYLTCGVDAKGPEALADEGEQHLAAGYGAIKVQVGKSDWRTDVARIAALRARLGDGFEIFVDAHMAYDRRTAALVGRGFRDHGVSWFEDPMPGEDLEGYAWLRRETGVPIVHGENADARSGAFDILRAGACDVLMMDSMHCGGPSEMLAVAGLAAAHHVPVSSHAFHAIAPHVIAACDQVTYVEYQDAVRIFEGELVPVNGVMTLSDRPGFGIDVQSEVLEKYRVDS